MTDIEMREFDAWIAEHVMGWEKFNPKHDWSFDCWEMNNGGGMQGTLIYRFQPTTDPAAAMQVLEKCAEKIQNDCGVVIYRITKGWVVESDHCTGMDDALPLAIAKFAHLLFQNER